MADVFISYSRRDQEFVRELVARLTERGKECWVDWDDIPPTAAFLQEIYEGIEASNAFLFVISPDSARSQVCRDEIEHAAENNKRIVPLLRRDPDGTPLPEAVASLNWIQVPESADLDGAVDHLVEVLAQDLDHVRRHTRTLQKAHEWSKADEDASLLLRGSELRTAEEWIAAGADKEPTPTQLHYRYLQASRAAAAKRQRQAVGAFAVGIVVALALAVVALIQRSHAVKASHVAESRLLANEAQSIMGDQLETGALLAVAAYRIKPTPEARSSMADAVERSQRLVGLLRGGGRGTAAAVSNGRSLAAGGFADGTVVIWDAAHRRTLARLHPGSGPVTSLSFSADGARLAAVVGARPVLWSITADGSDVARLRVPVRRANSVAFKPRGPSLIFGTSDAVVEWIPGGRPHRLMPSSAPVTSLAVSGDGRIAAGTKFGAVVRSNGVSSPSTPVTGRVTGLAFDPGSETLALAVDGSGLLWKPPNGQAKRLPGNIWSVAVGPRGVLVTGGTDGAVQVWSSVRQRGLPAVSLHKLQIDPGAVDALSVRPGLVAAAGSNSVAVWSTRGTALQRTIRTPFLGIEDLTLTGKNRVAIAYEPPPQVALQDLENGSPRLLKGAPGGFMHLAASSNGRVLVAGGLSQKLVTWAGADFEHPPTTIDPKTWKLHDAPSSLAVSNDGRTLLEVTDNGQLDLWHVGRSGPPRIIRTRTQPVAAAFTDSGAVLAVGGDGSVYRVYLDTARARRVGSLRGPVTVAAVSGDGRRVAAVRPDGSGIVWRVGSGSPPVILGGGIALSLTPGTGHPLAFDPSGTTVAAGDTSGGLYIWDARSGYQLAPELPLEGPIGALAFSPSGQELVAGLSGGGITVVGQALWTASAAVDSICARMGRPLSAGERGSYHLPGGTRSNPCR